jgi:hypothetical protein
MKRPTSAASAFYGPDGPKGDRKPEKLAKLDDYFTKYHRDSERMNAKRGAVSPLGGTMKPPQRKK